MYGSLLLGVAEDATHNVSIFDPVSPPAEAIRNLSVLVYAIIGAIFLVVEGILFYAILRFRKRGPDGGPEPPQVYGSKPIEIAWTAAPTLVVFVLVLVVTRTLWEVNAGAAEPKPGDKTLHVTVVGRQWWWEYQYKYYNGEEIGFITANELHIPASDNNDAYRTCLTLKSADVCHSYWVPRLAGKIDLIPGRVNYLWFETKEPGLYVGQCAEFCGTQHANMLLRVVVDTPDDFRRWLDNERKPAVEDPSVAEGKAAFLSESCVNCHRIRGTEAVGTYGPDLTHLMSRKTLASGMIPNDPENLKKWIRDPQKVKTGCLMPAFGLSERRLDQVVRYLATLR
jgi:cytochrome c oxidase subunit 2